MSTSSRRGVTRGYVGGLIAAAVIVAASLTVAGWGLLGLMLDRAPVLSLDTPLWAAPAIVVLALAALSTSLWSEALTLLRGRRSLQWGSMIGTALLAYLIWSLGGMLARMEFEDTWLSPFAWLLPPIWLVSAVLFWAVLVRRVYTDRPAPRWPWEREPREDGERGGW